MNRQVPLWKTPWNSDLRSARPHLPILTPAILPGLFRKSPGAPRSTASSWQPLPAPHVQNHPSRWYLIHDSWRFFRWLSKWTIQRWGLWTLRPSGSRSGAIQHWEHYTPGLQAWTPEGYILAASLDHIPISNHQLPWSMWSPVYIGLIAPAHSN